MPPPSVLAALARERSALLALLDPLAESVRAARPAPEAWSAVEVLEHLVRTEEAIVAGLERQIAAGDARRDVGQPSRLKVAVLLAAMASPVRIRIPERAPAIHPEGAPYGALRARFAACDARWEALTAALPAALTRVGLIRHPASGPLTAADAARFTAAHLARHRRQAARAVKAARG